MQRIRRHIVDRREWIKRKIEESQQPPKIVCPDTPGARLEWWFRSYFPQQPTQPTQPLSDLALDQLTAARQLLDSLAVRPLNNAGWLVELEKHRSEKRKPRKTGAADRDEIDTNFGE